MSNKILTTHVGSLPRSPAVTEIIFAKEGVTLGEGVQEPKKVNEEQFNEVVGKATEDIIKKQKEIGISIPSDGEMIKISYATYIKDRLSGFDGDSPRRVPSDLKDFPDYSKKVAQSGGTPTYKRPQCVAEIKVKDLKPLYADIEREKKALKKFSYETGFMNSASPGVIALFQPSIYHKSYEDYLYNLGKAMQAEYEAIVEAGLLLQIDSPDLALGKNMLFADKSEEDFLKTVELHLEVLNEALKNIPKEKIRLHVCWGSYEGPHHHDIELKKILPLVLKAKPRTLLFEGANPRHAYEWTVWSEVDIPDDYILFPGVIDSTSNFIEHPEVIVQRLKNFINRVERDRVIAGTDCGFATFAGYGKIEENIVWAKLMSLVKGAELASK